MRWMLFRRRVAQWAYWLLSPDGEKGPEIRPNKGAVVSHDRCEDTDEVCGYGFLHVEQMDRNCFWARLDAPVGSGVVMWFNSKSPIKLTAERD